MKKLFIIAELVWISVFSFAQSSNILVLTNEKTIGRIVDTQEDIKAKEYIFPEKVYDSYVDTTSHSITLQLRKQKKNGKWKNKGKIVFYDTDNEKIGWSKKINYLTNTIKQSGSTIIFTEEGKSYCLNTENGKNLWEINSYINHIDPVTRFGIGYKVEPVKSYSNTITLEWFDLKNGKMMWFKTFNKEYSVNDIFQLDSMWVIVADGLQTFNVQNGFFWNHSAVTGKKKYDRVIAANVLGVAAALLGGPLFITTGYDLVRDIVSNVLYPDSSGLYFASKEKISRLNKDNGAVIWSCPLPEDLTSKSILFAKDNFVYMINFGVATMGYRHITYGTPFFAAFNKENGNQIFSHIFGDPKNPIRHFKIGEDHILFVFKDKIVKCSLFDGSLILEKLINNKEFGELGGLIGDYVYIEGANSSMTNLLFSDASKNYIITSKEKLLTVDAGLNVVGDIDINQLYRLYVYLKEDHKLVKKVNDNQAFIMDVDNKKVAELDITRASYFIGNKLYCMREKSFFEIDLTNILNDHNK